MMLVWVVDLVAAGWRRKQKELMFFFSFILHCNLQCFVKKG